MKHLLLLAALISTSVSAATTVVAVARQADGFSPQPCRVRVVTVYADGEVIYTRCTSRPVVVTTLSPETIDAMVKLGADLVPARLNQETPGPSCMDAPSKTFSVVNAAGDSVDVGGNWGCRRMIHPNYNYGAARLHTVLEGLFELATI